MDRFQELQTFVRVAETLSISRTASQFGIAASAVSRRIRDLETRLGTQLFLRTTRKMRLTEAGRALYQRSLRILADLEEAESDASEERAKITGTLRLAVPVSLALTVLDDLISEFMERHPGLVVHIDVSDRIIDLVAEGIDVAIRVGSLSDSTLIARRLSTVRPLVCASPAFLERYGTPSQPEDLSELPALCYGNVPQNDVWTYLDETDRPVSVRVRPRMIATNGDVLRDAAVAGLGVTFAPSFILFREIEAGNLLPILPEYERRAIGIFAVYPPNRHLAARTRAFIDFLADRIGPEPFWEDCLRKARSARTKPRPQRK